MLGALLKQLLARLHEMKSSCFVGSRSLFAVIILSSILVLVLSACSGGGSASTTTATPPVSLKSIVVTPGNAAVAAGLAQQFKATGTYSDGTTSNITGSVTWTSATTSVATIDASGLATSKTQGTSVITATSGSISGSETLTVNSPALTSINLTATTIQLGTTAQIKATGVYTDKSTQDLTDSATWDAANGYVASVNSSGVATSVGAGNTTITAAQGSVQGSASLTVLASPRYLYVAADAGRTLTRLAMDGNTGQPRFTGYISTMLTNNIGFPCLTVDPSGTHAYLATQVTSIGGTGYAGAIDIFSIDPATGTLAPFSGSQLSVSFPLGCIHFDPSGKFAYATTGIENAGDQLGEFSVNADATLTLNNTISFAYDPTGVAVDPIGQYVYVDVVDVPAGTVGSSQLYGYSIDSTTGALTPLTGSPWSIDAGTFGQLAFHPSGNFLYVSDLNAKNILEYTLDRSSGTPTKSGTLDSTCINPSALQFLPSGNHAYALCGESGTGSVANAPIVEYAVGSNGSLTPHSTAFAGAVATQMQVDEAGKFLYVLGSGSDSSAAGGSSTNVAGSMVLAYQVQPDGSLKLANQIAGHVLENSMALMSGPLPVKWTTTNAYITTSGDNQLTPYAVAADGTLTAGAGLTTASGPFSASMLPWSTDLYLAAQTAAPNLYSYAALGNSLLSGTPFGVTASVGGVVLSPGDISSYATDPSSGLVYWYEYGLPVLDSNSAPVTFSAGAGARPITMDASGRYIVVANQTAKSISLIEPLGAAPTPPTSLSYTPLTVTVDGTGNLVFVAGDDGRIHLFSSNGLGALTDVADGTLLGTNTASVAVDPWSRFVYAAGPAGLSAFSIDLTADTLTPIQLSLAVSLANATGVFEDPSGQFLYVSVSGSTTNALYLFTINSDGTLTASSENPVATPNHVTSMVFRAAIQ